MQAAIGLSFAILIYSIFKSKDFSKKVKIFISITIFGFYYLVFSSFFINDTTTVANTNTKIVYYTENGKSYHYNKSCKTLSRSKNIQSGKLEDVIKEGHSDPCDICVN